MGEFEKSCVNCGVLNCAKRDKEYPEFCLTTNFDVKELEEIKEAVAMTRLGQMLVEDGMIKGKIQGALLCGKTPEEVAEMFSISL